MNPKILLLDEITSALDPELTHEVLQVVKNIVQEKKYTIIIVTHEVGFARDIADEVIFLDKGKIVEAGKSNQIFTSPKQERTKQFIRLL